MTNDSWNVYGIGNALVDFEVEVTDDTLMKLGIEKGVMTLIDQERQDRLLEALQGHKHGRACGGSAANTIIGVAQLGGRSFYSCRVANDEHGRFYLEDLQRNGVDIRQDLEHPEGVTGKCLVMVTPDAERTMNTFLGITSELHPSVIDERALARSEYLYVEGYLASSSSALETVSHARSVARREGVKVALSLSDPSMIRFFREGIETLIDGGVDLLFCNADEATAFTGSNNLETAVTKLAGVAEQLVVTLGKDGAILWDGHRLIRIPGRPARAVDTNGAGDLFAGAFLYGLTHGYNHQQAGELAVFASSLLVERFGPRLGVEEVARVRQKAEELTS
jgi:sugar/nucleoside kinase (ribokinase family)